MERQHAAKTFGDGFLFFWKLERVRRLEIILERDHHALQRRPRHLKYFFYIPKHYLTLHSIANPAMRILIRVQGIKIFQHKSITRSTRNRGKVQRDQRKTK